MSKAATMNQLGSAALTSKAYTDARLDAFALANLADARQAASATDGSILIRQNGQWVPASAASFKGEKGDKGDPGEPGAPCNAHHYTSTETIIGTWIDGRPIYRKVVTGLRTPGEEYKDLIAILLPDPVIENWQWVLGLRLIYNRDNGAPRVLTGSGFNDCFRTEQDSSQTIHTPALWVNCLGQINLVLTCDFNRDAVAIVEYTKQDAQP
ncbi:MAG: hypothetical protein J5820_01755 [Rhodocyclaceae bacterium]|nr:hypothetical protein [Rhodocyclaceae bacterium]